MRQPWGAERRTLWLVGLLALAVCSLETGLRLGAASPDTRYTLPQFSLGYFWDTPLGWTGLVGGVPTNRDSVELASLSGFFRDQPVPVPPADNVYVRFGGYALMGTILAPLVGVYGGFVLTNLGFWVAGALATYLLALDLTRSRPTAVLATLLVATAPAFSALAGQALPYVASYGLFALCLLLFERVRLFSERSLPVPTLLASGAVAGLGFLFYDLYMLPAFVVCYGLLRRVPLRTMVLVLLAMAVPRLVWSGYWQLAHLPSYAQNEQHPLEALAAWFDSARTGDTLLGKLKGYALLGAHGLLNVTTAFLFWPVLLGGWELWQRRRQPEAAWFVAVLVAGFAPALFMLSTWPHIPRWYAYGYPAVYILAAAGALRLGQALGQTPTTRLVIAGLLVVPAIVLANLDILGYTKPMELLLFQPTNWSYLWSR